MTIEIAFGIVNNQKAMNDGACTVCSNFEI